MFDIFPKTPKTIRARIQSYERKLKQELETGYGGDGYGKRYLPGPLYMLPGDVDGALASFEWYERAYPSDCGDPYQYLTWSLTLYRKELRHEAGNKLYPVEHFRETSNPGTPWMKSEFVPGPYRS